VTRAQVIVLAGPSGAGKSRLAASLGPPVVRLDDFYKDLGDPSLPVISRGANSGLTDWDDPRSWHQDQAIDALRDLCRTGRCEVPDYDLSRSARVGWHVIELDGHERVVAEGIFAPEVVRPLADEGLLAAAYCITQHPLRTFWNRLTRDLRERRKPPHVLLLRGLALMRGHHRVVSRAVRAGCEVATGDEARIALTRLPGA
jgi:uridine kinase